MKHSVELRSCFAIVLLFLFCGYFAKFDHQEGTDKARANVQSSYQRSGIMPRILLRGGSRQGGGFLGAEFDRESFGNGESGGSW